MALGRFVKSFVIKAYYPVAELIDEFFAKKTPFSRSQQDTVRYIKERSGT